MKKEPLLSALLLTGFISQSAAFSAVPELYKHKNIFYQEGETLIATPAGHGGGGKKTKEQQQKIDEAKEAAKKAAKKRINSKIEKLEEKATKTTQNNEASFQEWANQLFIINDKIDALKNFLDEIPDFIDYSIKKYDEISSEYNDGDLSLAGQFMLLEYVKEFKKISKRAKELGLTTNDEIKNLLKSLDSNFGKFAESLLN